MSEIFISHRTADRELANVIYHHLQRWGFSRESIFFSSAPSGGPSNLPVGGVLRREIGIAAKQAKLMILIYTFPDEDWSWCMYECGLSIEPEVSVTAGETDTRIVVFQCTDSRPKIFEDLLLVHMDEPDTTRKFVRSLLCGEIPGVVSPFKDPSEEVLAGFANEFFVDLLNSIPQESKIVNIYRWDFFVLLLTAEEIEQIQSETAPEARLSTIKNSALVCKEFGSALKHFDYDLNGVRNASGICDISQEKVTLQDLIQRWNESNTAQSPDALGWADELAIAIDRAIGRRASLPTRHLMKSLFRRTNGWLHLHLNVVRKMADDSREFEIYMYRLEDNLPWLKCEVLQ